MALFVASAALLIALLGVRQLADFLGDQSPVLRWMSVGMTAVLPAMIGIWYASSYAEVRRGTLTLRSLRGRHALDLKTLVEAEVYERGRGSGPAASRRAFNLMMRLQDADGEEIWLPLNAWRDEDLLMAVVLRATVVRKVRISGDIELVRRFSGLLDTYKSWDRQQAAA